MTTAVAGSYKVGENGSDEKMTPVDQGQDLRDTQLRLMWKALAVSASCQHLLMTGPTALRGTSLCPFHPR